VESISKLDVISIILKNSDKSCRFQEIYTKLQAHLTMSQLMKFIFELKKYDLLISLGDESNYTITPKGMQYLQIHEELTNQIDSGNTRNLRTFNSYSWLE
jgi:predicted transcriptional regulator